MISTCSRAWVVALTVGCLAACSGHGKSNDVDLIAVAHDLATVDSVMPDTAMPDTAMPDTATPDTATPDDAATPDLVTPDLAEPDLVTLDMVGPRELYVDPAAGADTNPGTMAEPYKTIAHAAANATAGSTIHLLDGDYTTTSEPAFGGSGVTLPANVTVHAENAGAATLAGVLVTSGPTTLSGLTFQGGTPGVKASSGTLTMSRIRFLTENVAGSLQLSGTVVATLVPDNAANYGTVNALAILSGSAQLTVTGGKMTGIPWGGLTCPALFRLSASATLTLDAVTLDGNAIGAVAAIGSSTVHLKNGTIVKNTSRATSAGAPCSGALYLEGTATLDVNASQIVENPGPGIRVATNGSAPSISLTAASSLSNNDLGMLIVTNAGRPSAVTIKSSTVDGNANGGIILNNGAEAIDVEDSTITNNLGDHGILDFYTGSGTPTFYVRRSTFTGNGKSAIRLIAPLGTAYDFGNNDGNADSLGQNTFKDNSVSGTGNSQLYLAIQGATTLYAAGNTWMPNAGGTDGAGHYATGTATASKGPNFTLELFGGGGGQLSY